MNAAVDELRGQLERYKSFLAQDPDNANLTYQVAEMLYRLSEFDESNTLIDQALAKHPGENALLLLKSNIAMATGQASSAVEILESLIAAGHTDKAIRYNLAYALLYVGRHEDALSHLDELQEFSEEMPEVSLLRARVLHHLGDVEQAILSAEKYLDLNPNSSETSGVLALLNYDGGQNEIATKWAEQTLVTNSSNLEALITLGSIAVDSQNGDSAKKHFATALEKHPTSGRAWSGLGLTDMLGMDIDKAIDDLGKAVKYMPNHIGTWHALAWCQLITDDIQSAKKSLLASLDIDRNFGETHGGLAVIDVLEGNLDEARIKSKKALRLDPLSFSGRFAQSLLLDRSGNTDDAKKIIHQILSSKIGDDTETVQMKIARQMKNPEIQRLKKKK